MSSVKVYDEWGSLEEIIVGTARYARIPKEDRGSRALCKADPDLLLDSLHQGYFPDRIVEETEEDLTDMINELQHLGIKVKRPKPMRFEGTFRTLDWESEQYFSYCPRDVLLTIDDMVIETPNVFRSQYFATFAYKEILIEYLKSGTRWISAPKPRLLDESYNTEHQDQSALKNLEPIFDAANVLRAGRDIFYLVSDSGNELGCNWLQTILGHKFRVHPCHNLYSSVHIDSTIALLRHGLALVNPARVSNENIPGPLKKWKVLVAPRMVDYKYSDLNPMSSVWLGMNLLMLAPNLAIVDKHQTPLIKLLEKNDISVIPLRLRHGRALGGGFHCITLDVRRSGELEDYF